jgi:hypothetical protein
VFLKTGLEDLCRKQIILSEKFRSFTFEIRQRKTEFGDKPIYNLNVRGRRGNFVQGKCNKKYFDMYEYFRFSFSGC